VSDYILADDLSGALETGAAFRTRGWRVTLPIDPAATGECGGGCIQVVSTETRAASPERAAEVVRGLVATRHAAGSRLLFKKIDSTLRGPIGAEITAIRSVLEPQLTVVCPANPGARRVVRDGVLFVGGTPLAETEFNDDPQWPARSSRVGETLESQGLSPTGSLSLDVIRAGRARASLAASIAAGTDLVVADAETDDDLRLIASAVREAGPGAMLIGSGALGAAVANELPSRGERSPRERHQNCHRVLVLCGSAHPRSHEQLRYLAERVHIAVIPFVANETVGTEVAAAVASSLQSRGVAAIQFTSLPGVREESARRIQRSIADWTCSHFGRLSPDLVLLTGGETAWTVCREIGGSWLEILGEPVAGVVLSSLNRRDAESFLVATKPGGFGSPDCFYQILPDGMK
jgi:uncharacterized protein YgbK (DUF1537 family)